MAKRTEPSSSGSAPLLSVPLAVIVPFNVLLARLAGPWIVVVAMHLALLWRVRRAFERLWSYRETDGGR
ncbi:MAG: hypothetical protein U0Q12_12145 [Vicinamibacterales bacterium]